MSRQMISKADAATSRASFYAEADATITAGQIVAYDIASTGDDRYRHVVPATGSLVPAGVAVAAAADGEQVEVVYWGIISVADVTATDGDAVISGAAGEAVTATDVADLIVGVAIETKSGAAGNVFVRCSRA